ncbi:MAG: polyamine ABC transporter ATP-binding protein [Clostridia bacterium]|nr:polyamine ABC transporter ATP-binding protein [Clostridia bacterium]
MEKCVSGADVLIRLEDLCKSFDNEQILKSVNLTIRDKEFVTLLGPSGCGKTTILRCIAGFETPDAGSILFEEKSLVDTPAHLRPINTVFQKYALFPHLNVFDNVAFGLRIKKLPEKEIRQKVRKMLAMVDLKGYEKRPIAKLSGGQQQRVAIARALVNMPRLLLLDEPLGALDLKLRKDMQLELKNLHRQSGITFLYVTHDQEEALTMSDTIVVMKSGTIQQIGSPQDIYNEPANAFVADFIGESNIFDARMNEDGKVYLCGAEFICVDRKPAELVDVVIRPEDVEIVSAEEGTVVGLVEASLFKGVHYEMTVSCGGEQWIIHSTRTATPGDTIGMRVAPENIHVMKRMFPHAENVVEATVASVSEEGCELAFDEITVSCPATGLAESDEVTLTLAPEAIELCDPEDALFSGVLDSIVWKGSYYEMIIISQHRRWLVKSQMDEQVGSEVFFRFAPEGVRLGKGAQG